MNQDPFLQVSAERSSPSKVQSKVQAWLGKIITGLLVLFFAFDGITKVIRLPPVIETCQKLGIGPDLAFGIGILLLVCTTIYVIRKTAILGAILLTGYFGGAVTVHLLARSEIFAIGFSLGCGALVWAGLLLREPDVLHNLLRRR